MGLSVGGPIIRDRLHIFGAYEGNYQDRDRRVTIVPPTGFPALDTVDFASRNGLFLSPFRSTNAFAKLSYAAGAHASLEATLNVRHETDTRDFGDKRPFESGVQFRNAVATAGVKFTYAPAEWLNEFTLSYQRARDNPSPVPGDQTVNRFFGGAFCCAQLGPDVTIQDFVQRRFALRNDLTYSGWRWSGAGLATVYGIVKQSDGFIWVASEPGRGATFRIYLPRVDAPVEERTPRRPETDPAGGTETILVVEDSTAVREVSRAGLERYGYTVLEAGSGTEALRLAGEHRGPIHLLFTDVVMAEISGRELGGSCSPRVPVCACSTRRAIATRRSCVTACSRSGSPFSRSPSRPGRWRAK